MFRKLTIPAALAVLVGLALLALRAIPPRRVPTGWPVNLGHRGAPVRQPENTIPAFRAALEAGAEGLELDVRLTRDGHPVVMHDATVNRTTDGFGAVAGMALHDVRRLGVRRRDGQAGSVPIGVPTLREVLAEFPGVPVNVDIKDTDLSGAGDVVLDVLRQAGAGDRALVASAHYGAMRRIRRAGRGEFATGASRAEIGVFYALSLLRLEGLARPAYVALQVPTGYGPIRIVTRRFVRAAHSRGVRVDVWTINDPRRMREVLDLGADAVITDDPGTLAEILRGRGS